jgi:MFS family permease
VLTEYANWRWCLLVNVPVAIVAVVAAIFILTESKAQGDTRYDIPGAISVTVGLGAIVFGCARASTDGWGSALTIGSLVVGAGAIALFVLIEHRSTHPLLPLRIVLHPTRGGSYLTSFLAGGALLGALLLLTYYMQITLGYSPLRAGLGSLPMTAVFVFGTRFTERLTNRFGPQRMMVAGTSIAVVGMVILTRIGLHTPFALYVLPGQVVLGVGLCALFIPLSSAALIDVDDHDAGAASGMLNATQEVGSAVGTAIFSTIYASAVSTYLVRHGASPHLQALAQIHGYVVAFWWAAAAMGVAALTALLLIRVPKPGEAEARPGPLP